MYRCTSERSSAPLPTYAKTFASTESWPERSSRPAALNAEAKIGWLLLLSSMPAAIVAVIFVVVLRQSDRRTYRSRVSCLRGYLVARRPIGRDERSMGELSLAHSFAMGIGQCVALLPGVSRSGIMITTAQLGYGRPHAAPRFLMGLPIIAGAAYSEASSSSRWQPSDMGAALLAGTATSPSQAGAVHAIR